MTGKGSKSDGFTVIEMLIAVAIVGILTTIAYPSYLKYLEKNKEAIAISDINAIATRLVSYRMEGILPAQLAQVNFGITLPLTDP